jgi:hypothetical protein
MPESDHGKMNVSQAEIMIRNLEAAGCSEEEIQYEMDGYGCMPNFVRFDEGERADAVVARDAEPTEVPAYRRLPR